MIRFFVFYSLLFLLLSCSKEGIHVNSLKVTPVENIQMLFERYTYLNGKEAGKWEKYFEEIRGNVLLIKKRKAAYNYLEVHKNGILLEKNLQFVYDTIGDRNKLYVIDLEKSFSLNPQDIQAQKSNKQKQTLIILDEITKANLSDFFAANIGKEMILTDENGFIAGASDLDRDSLENIVIRK